MATLDASLVVGKKLYAAKELKGRTYASNGAPVVVTFQPGQLVGTVFSWVEPTAGNVWWSFVTPMDFYLPHKKGNFNWEKLKEQLDPDQVPPEDSLNISPELACGVGLAALLLQSEAKNETQRIGLKLAGLAGIGYSIFKMVSRKLGEVDFNPFD